MTLAVKTQAGVGRRKTGRSEFSVTASSKPNSQTRTSETASESAGYTGSGSDGGTATSTTTGSSNSFTVGTTGVSVFRRPFILRHPKYAAIPVGKASNAARGPTRFGTSVRETSAVTGVSETVSARTSGFPEISGNVEPLSENHDQSGTDASPYASKSTFSRFSAESFRAAESMAAQVSN